MDASRDPAARKPVVLVVEDDSDLCEVMEGWLSYGGYTPRVYGDGESMLADDESLSRAVAAVLDIYLGAGHMTGVQVADLLKKRAPHVRVVIITGTDPSEALQRAYHVIAKPFPAAAVLGAIADRGNGHAH